MELKVFKDTVTTVGQFINTRQELPIEIEILIPDYLPEVFKIVKCFVNLVVLQKQVVSGRIIIEGYFKVEVFYQAQQQQLCAMEQKMPFSRQIELAQGEWIQTVVDVFGELQYINCRAINQRRLDIRGAYNLCAKVTATTEQQVVTAVSGMGLQQKMQTIPTAKMFASPDKQFTVEEEIVFDCPPQAVLHTKSNITVNEVKLVSGKAVVKGDIFADVLYRCDDNRLIHTEKKLTFNQIVELEGANETSDCNVVITPIGCTILFQGEEQKQYQISVTCLLNIKAINKQEVLLVVDSFSTHYNTQLEMQDVTSEIVLDNISTTLQVDVQGKLPDSDMKILDIFATCFSPELLQLDNDSGTKVQGKAIVHLICANSLGEIECFDKTCEYSLPKKYNISMQQIEGTLSAQCTDLSFSKTNDDANTQLTIVVSGVLMQKNKIRVLNQVTCTDVLQAENDIALRIYYAQANEAVFDIAKRYHASPIDIASLAGIETETLTINQRLLIPLAE